MSADDSLPSATRLLRVLKDKPVHVDPVTRIPTPAAFEPSSADLAHAPVRVSVWDADHVSLARAVELRGGGERLLTCVRSKIQRAREIAIQKRPRRHYGIEGLESDAWKGRRADRQHALRALAKACRSAT